MTDNIRDERGIDRAVRIAGTQRALADKLGITQQAVANMVRKGYCPLSRAIEIEGVYGIPRRDLLSAALADLIAPAVGG